MKNNKIRNTLTIALSLVFLLGIGAMSFYIGYLNNDKNEMSQYDSTNTSFIEFENSIESKYTADNMREKTYKAQQEKLEKYKEFDFPKELSDDEKETIYSIMCGIKISADVGHNEDWLMSIYDLTNGVVSYFETIGYKIDVKNRRIYW